MTTAAFTAAGLTGLVFAVTGPGVWTDWFTRRAAMTWLGWPHNLSLIGMTARAATVDVVGPTLSELPLPWLAVAGVVAAALWVGTVRIVGDGRWLRAIVWGVVASPLGWIYYVPLVLGPVLARWHSSLAGPLVALAVPLPAIAVVVPDWALSWVAGTIYTGAVLIVWFGATRR